MDRHPLKRRSKLPADTLRDRLSFFRKLGRIYRDAAVHEAGHALVMRRNAGLNVRCHINVGTKENMGMAYCDNMDEMTAEQRLEVFAAGCAAEKVVLGYLRSKTDPFSRLWLAGDIRLAKADGYDEDDFFSCVDRISRTMSKCEITSQPISLRDYSKNKKARSSWA